MLYGILMKRWLMICTNIYSITQEAKIWHGRGVYDWQYVGIDSAEKN